MYKCKKCGAGVTMTALMGMVDEKLTVLESLYECENCGEVSAEDVEYLKEIEYVGCA